MFARGRDCGMLANRGEYGLSPSEITKLNSRRNTVVRQGNRVVKRFKSSGDFSAESSIYDRLSGFSLAPKVLEKGSLCIVTEWIQGRLLFDLLEEALGDVSTQALLFELYFDWCKAFYAATGMNLGDTNFRNFILKEGKLYGVDFESCEPGSVARDMAWQCAMLVTLRPPYSRERLDGARLFLAMAQRTFRLRSKDLLAELAVSLRQVGQRREVEWRDAAYKELQSTVEVSSCVLAGGASSRMGRDKKSLKTKEDTFLSKALNSTSLFSDRYLSVAAENINLSADYNTIVDLKPGLGPLGGIVSVLPRMENTWAVFIPCDMPLLTAELLDYLISFRERDLDAVFFTEGGVIRTFPLLLQTRTAGPRLQEAVENGSLGLWRTATEKLRILKVPAEACPFYKPSSLKNINTMEDYEALQTICD
jgi:molybdenum cofactor guanylyltransferase